MASTDKKIIELVINGQSANIALKDLEKTSKSLWAQLRKVEDPAERGALKEQFIAVNNEAIKLRNELKNIDNNSKGLFGSIKNISLGVLGGNMLTKAVDMLSQYIPSVSDVIKKNAELADSFANIQKTTGLTEQEVEVLNEKLNNFNTRTSREELRQLAAEAGKLGKESVDDILDFVKQADMIKVALGEDLGEDAITQIGKLSNIFGTEMLNIASAINEVGAASEASESFQVDFLQRMSGTAPTVKIAADEVMGYGAALESLGQSQEVSATALNTFLIDFVANTEKFGKTTGFARGELKKLIEEKGTNDAFITFLERLKEGSGSSQEMINKLQDLGVDGARGANVLLTLANNVEKVKDQQLIANSAIQDGSSITREFEIRNNNLAGAVDKLKERMDNWYQSSGVKKFLESIIITMADTRSESEKLIDSYNDQKIFSENLEKSLPALTDRYEYLTSKAKLTKDEQAELKVVTNKLADIVPGAVTKWDSFGNAMGINAGKVKEFADAQKILTERMSKDAVKALNTEISDYEKKIQLLTKNLNTGYFEKYNMELKRYEKIFYNDTQLKEFRTQVAELRKEQQGAIVEKATLLGEDPNKYIKGVVAPKVDPNAKNKTVAAGTLTEEEIKENERKRKKSIEDTKRDYDQLKKELLKLKQEAEIESKPIDEQEIARVNLKYEELLKRAKGHLEETNLINELWNTEVNQVRMNQEKDEALTFLETQYAEEKLLLENKRSEGLISEEDYAIKVEEIELGHLLNLKTMRESFGEDTLDLEKKIADQQIQLSQAVTKNAKTQSEKQIEFLKLKGDAEIELANTQYDAIAFSASTLRRYLGESEAAFLAFLALEKSAAIAQIVLNMNKEIASYFAWAAGVAGPGGPLLAAPYVAAAKLRAGISIGAIAVQTIDEITDYSYGTPMFKQGGIVQGPSHEGGGVSLIANGQKVGEMEGGEPYMILSNGTYDNNKPLVDALLYSSMYEGGKSIMPNLDLVDSGINNYNTTNKLDLSQTLINISRSLSGLNLMLEVLNINLDDITENGINSFISYDDLRDRIRDARRAKRKSAGLSADGTTIKGDVFLNDDFL